MYLFMYLYTSMRGLQGYLPRFQSYGQFSYFRFPNVQAEDLQSQKHCLCSLQNALWKFIPGRVWKKT